MNWLRLRFQRLMSALAIPFGFNDRLVQFCDRCGRTHYLSFWADNDVWESVAGNANGHRHGAYCVYCFDVMATEQSVGIQWKPERINPC